MASLSHRPLSHTYVPPSFRYTTLEPSDVAAASSSSAPAFMALQEPEILTQVPSGQSTPVSAASKKPLNLALIFGPICAVVGLFLLACGYFLWRFKKRTGTKNPQDDLYSKDAEKEKGKPPSLASPRAQASELTLRSTHLI